MFKSILLQGKFILVEILNVTYNIIPNPLRNFYLRCFGIEIGSASSIHRCCKFFHVGKLVIGKNSVVNFGCYLDNRRGISIGNNVGVAHNTKIYTLGHNLDSPQFETKGAPVTIEDDVFIFSNVMIMPYLLYNTEVLRLHSMPVHSSHDNDEVHLHQKFQRWNRYSRHKTVPV